MNSLALILIKIEDVSLRIKKIRSLQFEKRLYNYSRSFTFILLVLCISAAVLVGCGLSQDLSQNISATISVTPALPMKAINNGTGEISISWTISYRENKIREYDLVISDPNNNVVLRNPYIIDDSEKGQHNPIKNKLIFPVVLTKT